MRGKGKEGEKNMETSGEKIKLLRPSMDYAEDIMKYRQEFLANNPDEDMGGTGNLKDCEKAEDWLLYVEALKRPETCPEGLVDSDTYLAVRESDNKIVGIIEFRHHIDHPILGLWGGHIGYCVRPCERRKGYAKEMLRQNLVNCQNRGLSRVMITCSETNIASEKTILSGGGKYEKTVLSEELRTYMKRFWIAL